MNVDLLFLGTGTSTGVPMIGCRCAACTSPDPRDARTRASVVLSYGDARVLIDTTPELRLQCVANGVDRIDAVVFTHAHADHIMGLDDCRRFNSIRGGPLDAWADAATLTTLRNCFGYAMRPPADEGVFRPQLVPREIDGPFEISGATWTPVPLMHGRARILGFRVGDLAYCTDASGIPDEAWPLLSGLDVLVLDALQPTKHPTHLSIGEALEVIDRLRPERAFLTHMSHNVVHAQIEPTLPEHVRLAYDGLRVTAG